MYKKGILLMLMMKVIAGLVIILLAGCAGVPDRDAGGLEQTGKEVDVDPTITTEKKTAISADVLYLLMTAEIAGQRNQYGVALEGYLEAAKRVEDARISERAAKIGLFIKDTKKTDEAIALWLKQDEKNLTARKIAVLSSLRGEDKSTAIMHLNKILVEDPAGFESTLMELTKALGKEGKAKFVYSVLEDISIQHQDQASVFFVQALLAGQLNRLDAGKQKINKALDLLPDWDKALILRAQLSAQSADLETAKQDLKKVLESSPKNNKVRKMLAQILMKTDELDESKQMYKDVLATEPEDGESQFAIALILLQQQKDDEALVYLKRLVNKPRWDAQASFYIGRLEFKKENYDEALVWFDKVTRGGYAYDASMAAVSVLLKQKNTAQAEKRLLAIKVNSPEQKMDVLLLRAEIYNENKAYQAAFDLITGALGTFPGHKDLLYSRALIAEKLDRLDILEADLKAVLVKHPNDASVLNALGYTLVDRTQRYQEAEKYIQQALTLKPDEAVIIDSMGWLQYKLGNYQKALSYLRQAYEKQSESEIAAHLVEVLWVMGDKAESKRIFDEAITKDPDDKYLLKFKVQMLAPK